MDILEFKRILTAFADEPSDVDVRLGKVVAQLRDELIDAQISYAGEQNLVLVENGQQYGARTWLINRVARLPQLADRIIAAGASAPAFSVPENFVPPLATVLSDISQNDDSGANKIIDAVEELHRFATNQVPGATRVVYITSDAGEGKTTVINRAAVNQARMFKSKQVSSLIVPIPLGGKAFLTFDDAVIAALVNKLRFNYLYYDAFIHLIRLGAIVPAFDGYEEMLVEGSKGEAVSALGNLVQSLDSSGTVLVAARKAFFEYLSFRTQAKLLDAIGDRSASFDRLALHRWSEEQFLNYGRLRGVPDAQSIYDIVSARLGADHPLVTRAVLVTRLFDVAEDAPDRAELAGLLGANPSDYFYTFVDAIVRREAKEKWLARVSGDVMEPLLEIEEHHAMLSQIAMEMWQTSANALRYDIADVVVELFAEARRKSAPVIRQIKERVKQHSLLVSDSSRGQALAFDHEDFQSFYLGEGLGHLLARGARAELQAFMAMNLVPSATIEQAVQYLMRRSADLSGTFEIVKEIAAGESGFTFCKENCSALAIRLVECVTGDGDRSLAGMSFPVGALSGRNLRSVKFEGCQFQPTSVENSVFEGVCFSLCEFERLEASNGRPLAGTEFDDCRIDSFVSGDDNQTFDPSVIKERLVELGARIDRVSGESGELFEQDERFKVLERFLRSYLRSTHMDESFIRVRVGKNNASLFFDEMLPDLLEAGVLEETQWKGQGVQRRYKLKVPMLEVSDALEKSQGTFSGFISAIR